MEEKTLGCVVMAAGSARRFGENKLAARLDGRSLIQRALEAVPPGVFSVVAVVTQYPEIEELAKEYNFTPIRNDWPDLGASRTVVLGLEATAQCDGTLFLVADQPLLRRERVAQLAELWRRQPEKIAALGHGGVRGNPCLFPARFYPELLALTGDRGGSAVIRRHEEDLILLEAPEEELADVDTPQALRRLRQEGQEP